MTFWTLELRRPPGGPTYAITHASAALVLKKKYPRVGLWPLLISVQLVELLWIVFTYLGIEHYRVTPDAVHLDFLPYSHSVGTGALLAALAWFMGKSARRSNLGVAMALGIFSHIVLDIIHHEPDIALLPMAWGPQLGLNLQRYPILDFTVELVFCIACWKIFGGSRGLLIGIVIFNVLNIPLMFPLSGSLTPIVEHPAILPTIILVQVVATWTLVWWLGKRTIFLDDPVAGTLF
ncbi:MAG TPA: hypothetical protein VF387_06565 [Gemmatimonadaceae bacterium]